MAGRGTGRAPRLRRAALVVVGVLVLAVGLVAVLDRAGVVGTLGDFSGHCLGGSEATEGEFDPVEVDGVATDPLHVVARAPRDAPAPHQGDQVTVVTAALTPPGIAAIVVGIGAPDDQGVPITISVWPRDHLAQTFVPGTAAHVTLMTNAFGKSETLSADSLRPAPAAVPGTATLWVEGPGPGDGPLGGRAHPVPVLVAHRVRDRVVVGDLPDHPLPPFVFGGTWGVVVPDHHCRTAGVWPPVLVGDRAWNAQDDTIEPWP